jgi:hypothetical protein
MKRLVVLFVSIAFAMASCSSEDDPTPVNDNLPEPEVGTDVPVNSTVSTMGMFTSFAHGLGGNTFLYINAEGDRTLRFENFTMSAGPDVYVLFSKSNNYSKANTIAVSMLKDGYSNQSINFQVPDSIDLETYKFVLVYCIQYNSLFGFSELKQ